MNREGVLVSERLAETMMMCSRENPIYEQISNYGIALYVVGVLRCGDLLSVEDIEVTKAAQILKERFEKVDSLPMDYDIRSSPERYLAVVGDPYFPEHFAVFTSSTAQKPFFSKLRFFGSGFDSIEEIRREFTGFSRNGFHELSFYRLRQSYS
jgi:hypothetical protein